MYLKTPYQLRFEIFKQSYNMLQDEFVHYVNIADQKVSLDMNDFDYPEPPTLRPSSEASGDYQFLCFRDKVGFQFPKNWWCG
jgi:hypothetical protein